MAAIGARAAAGLSPELAAEVRAGPWMYEFELSPGISTPPFSPILGQVHRTRAEMLEQPVRAALSRAGREVTAIDLACNEGWFSHRLLEWGATRVIGVDIREANVRRANLVRDHFGISPERLTFLHADVLDLDPGELGRFDVVLMLGLVYHLENPGGAVRIARALTRGLCAIESQLTRQSRPILHGMGHPHVLQQAPASFAAILEQDSDRNPLASAEGLVSLIPNRAALEHLASAAGFEQLQWVPAQPRHELQYVQGDRGILLARPRAEAGSAVPSAAPGEDTSPSSADGRAATEFGAAIRALLPAGTSLRGRRALDLGPGLGRPLEGLGADAALAEPAGATPLDLEAASFALVSAYSVFSRLAEDWAEWLIEVHRLLEDGGLAVLSFLGQGAAVEDPLIPAWEEDATGMLVLRSGPGGGATVYHSAWWIREHWGRAFDVLRIQREGLLPGPGRGEGVVMLRKRSGAVTARDLERVAPDDPREAAAWRTQLDAMRREDSAIREGRAAAVAALELQVAGARRSRDAARARAAGDAAEREPGGAADDAST